MKEGTILDISEVKKNKEIEIDFMAFLLKLKSLWRYLVLGTLCGALITLLYAMFIRTPMYESSSQVYLRGNKNSVSLSDLQIGAELTNDYEIIFKSRPNMEKVIKDLDLDMSVRELRSVITISNLSDTRILEVIVKCDDPKLARDITNEVVENGMNSVREIDSKEPYLIENAIANTVPTGLSKTMFTILGGIAGFAFTFGYIFVSFMLKDTIQSVEDVEDSLGLPVLGVVVEDESLTYAKKNSKSNKKSLRKGSNKIWK